MAGPIAVLDACVLYSAPLRDVMLSVATIGRLFHPRWTEEIRDEYVRNLRSNRPDISQDKLDWTWQQMCTVPDCLVTGYEPCLTGLSLPDMTDCHVLAAAIHARASLIVTYNTRDFPSSHLTQHGLKAVSPDTFLLSLLKADQEAFCDALRRQRKRLIAPPQSIAEFLTTLGKQRLTRTVRALQPYLDSL